MDNKPYYTPIEFKQPPIYINGFATEQIINEILYHKKIKEVKKLYCDSDSPSIIPNIEFEVRIGYINQSINKFYPWVSKKKFNTYYYKITNSDFFKLEDDWHQEISYYWNNANSNIGEVRTTSKYKKNKRFSVDHITKKKIYTQNIKFIQDITNKNNNIMRLNISIETPVHKLDIPNIVNPRWVRIKVRKNYIYKDWRYSFIKIWEGVDHKSAELSFINDSPKLSIEIENNNPKLFQENFTYAICSLLMKGEDFFENSKGSILV
jgi:hypothetical protein